MAEQNAQTSANYDDENVCTENAKRRISNQLEADVEVFLSRGGSIEKIEVNVSADPPIKPTTKYGGQPI